MDHDNASGLTRTGLFFGTFDPVHIGHLVIGEYMVEFTDLEEVWFVVSPQNPLKEGSEVMTDHHRIEMVRLAVGESPLLKLCRDEFDRPRPSYTYNTLQYLSELYTDRHWTLIMGEDNLRGIDEWWNGEAILDEFRVFVYPRHLTQKEREAQRFSDIPSFAEGCDIHRLDAPVLEISATFIREAIKAGREVRYMLTRPVYDYVRENRLYAV